MQHIRFLPTLPSLLAEKQVPLIHRDLSWLHFNERVLAESRQGTNPLLERAKFLSITATNTDEFFMVRFASLNRQVGSSSRGKSADGAKVNQLKKIRLTILETVAKFVARQQESLDLLSGELEAEGIVLVRANFDSTTSSRVFSLGKAIFDEKVLPNLGAAEIYSVARVQGLENLQMGVWIGGNIATDHTHTPLWFRVPKTIPGTFVELLDGVWHLFFLDELLLAHLPAALGRRVEVGVVRLIRDADVAVDLDDEDPETIPDQVRNSLATRERGVPVCLQYSGAIHSDALAQLGTAMKLGVGQIFSIQHPLTLGGLWSAVNRLPDEIRARPALSEPAMPNRVPPAFQNPEGLFDELRRRDYLLHHPYDSFDAFVIWMKTVCADPKVESVEITVYRTDTLSPLMDSLQSAAALGKKVRVVFELRARFDELNNLQLAEKLREGGVNVAFGFAALKLHAKIALVTRREEGELRFYTHLSTGNYKASTARAYTDLAILTANPEIGADARKFFDALEREEVPTGFKHLVTAPLKLHRKVISLIDREMEAGKQGKPARIFAKVNALIDEAVIQKLYEASQAGVKVDLVVRGACSLIPGVKGLSENIRVISVVDRFLEHSRIYSFESSQVVYLSSADWMQRNFFSRLEIAFPVLDPLLHRYLTEVVIPAYLEDRVKAKELTPQGLWKKRSRPAKGKPVRSQKVFEDLAASEYRGTVLESRESTGSVEEQGR